MTTLPTDKKTIIKPQLWDVLSALKQDIAEKFNCVKVGEIDSFDVTSKTATVKILFKRLLNDGTTISYPLLLDCPVFTLQGGGGFLQFPIATGDQCIVLFSDCGLDEWLQNGAEAVPGDGRRHDLSDGIALVGLNALNSTLPDYPTNMVVLSYKGTSIQLEAGGIDFIGTGGAELDLVSGIVTLKNMTTTLLTLMNGFITLLEAAQVQGPGATIYPFTVAYIALLEAYKAQFATLLG